MCVEQKSLFGGELRSVKNCSSLTGKQVWTLAPAYVSRCLRTAIVTLYFEMEIK